MHFVDDLFEVAVVALPKAEHLLAAGVPYRKLMRLDLPLTPSTWGIWVLSHVDLRSTARVRVSREFVAAAILENKALILGEASRYFEPHRQR